MRPTALLAGMGLLWAAVASASAVQADVVLLLPARGQVPGAMLSTILENETRYGVIEVGHKLVEQPETAAALRQVADGAPDNSDEFASMARFAHADWVVLPTVFPQDRSYRLELIAFQTQGGRSESVTRDIDTDKVHQQVVEMLRVLLRPEGVGTGALPWEMPGVRPQTSAPTPKPRATAAPGAAAPPAASGPWPLFLVGAGASVSSAVSRPDDAAGSSTSTSFAARAGISPVQPVDIALQFASALSGPRSTMIDASARYMIPVAGVTFRIGPEAGVGVFMAHGGAESKSLMMRGTLAASLAVTRNVMIEATAGDLRWIPASSGTVVLAGGTVQGVVRF